MHSQPSDPDQTRSWTDVSRRPVQTRIVVFAGRPGSGKGTQCARLTEQVAATHISLGEALREEVMTGTPLGERARIYLEAGRLVPDADATRVVLDRIAQQHDTPVVLLDGFPRTLAQAETLDRYLPGSVHLAVNLVVPTTTVLRRAHARGRSDDRSDVLRHRLATYQRDSRPLLGWFANRGLLVQIDADQPSDAVTASLLACLARSGCAVRKTDRARPASRPAPIPKLVLLSAR